MRTTTEEWIRLRKAIHEGKILLRRLDAKVLNAEEKKIQKSIKDNVERWESVEMQTGD